MARIIGTILCCLFVLSALLIPTAGTRVVSEPNSIPNYRISANLDYESGRIEAKQQTEFTNDTGVLLNSIVFNVVPAYFGGFWLNEVQVDGKSISVSNDDELLEIPLDTPLAAGAKTTIALDYTVAVPSPGNLRFGQGRDVMALGNWYPILAVWQSALPEGGSGWRRDRYVDTGDAFFSGIANYEVEVEADPRLVMGHTGQLVRQQGSSWSFKAEKVRDFALTVSDRYQLGSVQVGNTLITSLFLPEHAAAGKQYLESAAGVVRWFGQKIAAYPYPSLIVAETESFDANWVGQEYPNLLMISSSTSAQGGGAGSYLDYLLVHETLHQWFYNIVGNDQIYEPWLDESLATYFSYLYFRDSSQALFDSYLGSAASRYEGAKSTWRDMPLNSSIYDYGDESHYFAMVYAQGALFLDDVRKVLGDADFYAAVKQYVQEYSYRIAGEKDFIGIVETKKSGDLAQILEKYFSRAFIARQHAPPTPTAGPSATPSIAGSPISSPTVEALSSSVPSQAKPTTTATQNSSTATQTLSLPSVTMPSPWTWWWVMIPIGGISLLLLAGLYLSWKR